MLKSVWRGAMLVVVIGGACGGGRADENILGHCRSGGEHVRGCWAVDAILGRS